MRQHGFQDNLVVRRDKGVELVLADLAVESIPESPTFGEQGVETSAEGVVYFRSQRSGNLAWGLVLADTGK
ncbi:MAG: hypothetical protein ACT4P7_09675 [Gemmatimonadaceae bacterium]